MSAKAPKDAGSASKKGDVFNGVNRGRKRKFSAVNEEPPQLTCCAPTISEIQTTNDALLPVDILLLTVKDCEFSACYVQIHNPYECWFDDLGFVYFGHVGSASRKENLNVALLKCNEGSTGPGGSLMTTKNAVIVLRPKAVISVGTCSGLNPEKTKLGEVVISAKLTTYASKAVTRNSEHSTGMRSYVSKRFLNLIKDAALGWEAPLKNPGGRQVKVHSAGEVLSGPELVNAERRRKQLAESHPQAIAITMEGEGENISTQFPCQSTHTATDLHMGQSLSASQVRRLLQQCSALLVVYTA